MGRDWSRSVCPGLVFSLWTSYFLLSTGDWGQGGAIGETKFILSNWRLVSGGEISFFFHSDSVWFHLLVILADGVSKSVVCVISLN